MSSEPGGFRPEVGSRGGLVGVLGTGHEGLARQSYTGATRALDSLLGCPHIAHRLQDYCKGLQYNIIISLLKQLLLI